MAADDRGLVHGGFVFSAADYAAMLAVNEPNVVLASSRMSCLAPVRVGEVLEAAARTRSTEGRSHEVEVVVGVVGTGASRAAPVATGVFRCVVTPTHVLDGRAVGPEER
jgi:acyl-coenzyme A thioesterase PaaI-like protein